MSVAMKSKQQGLSLIELMISITVGLILMTGVVQLFLTSKTTFSTQQALSRIQETGRLAIDFMAEDIRMAGYMGCATRGATNLVNGLDADEDDLGVITAGIVGYRATENYQPTDDSVKADTDLVVVRHAGSNAIPIMQPTNHGGKNNANIDVKVGSPDGCVEGLCDDDLAVISDCAQGRIFRATNISDHTTWSRIVHSQANSKVDGPKNKDSKLGGQQFGDGAEIIKLKSVVFYIAESAVSGEPGLWQRIDDETYELMQGVEDMSLRYGAAGTFYEAANVPDWNLVDSVRVELLVRSIEDNVVPESQSIVFAGKTVEPEDRRMRQVFSSTIAIRNRLQ